MDGGKAYGKGAFGAVYGDPPPPCENSKPTDDETVGKVFFGKYSQESANEEYDIFKLIREKMSKEDYAHFRKVAVIPRKLCKVDMDQITRPPYTDPTWQKTSTGKIINVSMEKQSPMIIYDKAISDLGDYIEVHANDPLILTYKTRSIIQAVSLLHKYDICHLDIKTGNILVSTNHIFQLADFGKAIPVSKATMNNLTYYPGYFPHPSCVVFILPPSIRREMMDEHLFSEFNTNNYQFIHQIIYLPFLPMRAAANFGFTPQQKAELTNYAKQLNLQKFFGFDGFWNELEKIDEPDKTPEVVNKIIAQQIENYRIYMKNPSEPFKTLLQEDFSQSIVNLYKKADIYSIGIILLEILGTYYKNNSSKRQTSQMCKNLMKIYRLAFSLCDYMNINKHANPTRKHKKVGGRRSTKKYFPRLNH